ncbi:adenylate kinase 7 isoform X2 [Salmo salar]|uniref:Adenylate kinase 7 isoform X2 n=1 Tax=Salmo salar TaxID=8030 RepID=A0A1S3M8F0_SALSA|nr:adenylate kinase 7 isoform X2 [Salmo salar]|eukprot:XP_013999274.1 PREDICTED: adenylate kinase 7-like isoform X2 [Salmo salar]
MANEKKGSYRTKRVFVNNIDTYSSKCIAKFLSTCMVGGSLEEADEDGPAEDETTLQDGTFQIVGTISNNEGEKPSFALECYTSQKRDQLLPSLLECDVVVYNISEHATAELIDEATWAISALHSDIESFVSQKIFILISSVMTWAMSKPADPNDPEIPLTEDDYRRKKHHPNFKEHTNAEKTVLKLGKTKKSKLSSYVVAAGIQYGMGENLLHYFFKIISFVLGPGKIKKVPKEEAYLTNVLTNADMDYLSVNLRIEPIFLKETFNLHWVSEAGIIDNINRVVEEYKLLRLLRPIRICLLGPPAVGKSSVAEKLCKHYKLHHINLKEVIDEMMKHLEEAVNGAEQEGESEEAVSNAQDQLDSLKDSMEQNEGRLSDGLVYRIIRDKLNSTPCRNHGFVLDGFPKSYDQAKEIFYDELDYPRSKMPAYNKKIIPEFIFSLEASDDFLKERVQNLPESVVEKMHYSKDEYLTRLKKFRKANVEDETVLNYFDELEIHPEHIEVNNAVDPEYGAVMDKITRLVGRPRNYGPTPEEREEMERKSIKETAQRLVLETAEWKRREAETAAKMATQLEQWNRHVTEVKRQEHELLEARSAPLRNYLMNYVMPSLTEGMMECCKAKPDDPVDFLAEYLLRNNSQD